MLSCNSNNLIRSKLPKLEKGSTIGIISPSNPITYEAPYAAKMAEAFLNENGYNIKHGKQFGKTDSYYRSGTIEERAQELNDFIHDDGVDCIMAAIGGYVSNSILPYIDYDYLKEHPKIIVGHSDITSILLAIYEKCNFPTFYGPNLVTSFAHNGYYQKFALNAFERAVNHKEPYIIENPNYFTDEVTDWYVDNNTLEENLLAEKMIPNKMKTIVPGKTCGRLIGGNTDRFSLLYGSPFCPQIKEGDILFLESINETADFFECAVSRLFSFGIFDKISGLILGKPKGYNDLASNKNEIDIFAEIVKNPQYPILADFDCGHTLPINTLPIGSKIILDSTKQQITLL